MVGESCRRCYLSDGHVGALSQQPTGIFQPTVADEAGQRLVATALGEGSAHTFLRELKTFHDGFAVADGIEEEFLPHDFAAEVAEQLFVGECTEVDVVNGRAVDGSLDLGPFRA